MKLVYYYGYLGRAFEAPLAIVVVRFWLLTGDYMSGFEFGDKGDGMVSSMFSIEAMCILKVGLCL